MGMGMGMVWWRVSLCMFCFVDKVGILLFPISS